MNAHYVDKSKKHDHKNINYQTSRRRILFLMSDDIENSSSIHGPSERKKPLYGRTENGEDIASCRYQLPSYLSKSGLRSSALRV